MPYPARTFAILLALTAAPVAQAAEYAWGAIALDTSDLGPDGGYGLGGGDNEAEAKENALKYCAEDGAKAARWSRPTSIAARSR